MSLREFAVWVYGASGKIWYRIFSDESRISALEKGLKNMADELDTIDSKFDTYQALVVKTIADLKAEVAAELNNQLDPVKAKAIEDKMDAAIATLSPPEPPA
jgi:hypothetical protein